MKKFLLPTTTFIICLLAFTFNTKAQLYLTNRQVYNFDVGDEFETEACSNNCIGQPPLYNLIIVLKKWTSVTLDTIYYIDSNVSQVPWTPFSAGSFSTGRDTIFINNLDSNATPPASTTCPWAVIKDSLYYDSVQFCGRKAWLRYPYISYLYLDSCFEPKSQSSFVVEGCGGPYTSFFDPTGPFGESMNLIYYKKLSGSCGSKITLDGINNIKANTQTIKVYPNPSNGKFSVEATNFEGKYQVEVYNLLGEMVYSSPCTINPQVDVDIIAQPSGMYFIKVIGARDVQVFKVTKR